MTNMLLALVIILTAGILSAHAEQHFDTWRTLETFIEDIIDLYQLTSPTLIFQGDDAFPEICKIRPWILCLADTQEVEQKQLTLHLETIHKTRKQDGILFIGTKSHENILLQLVEFVPTIFTSACPVFMPIGYLDIVHLQLNSNIIFLDGMDSTAFILVDVFAVKGGPPITLDIGTWEMESGIILNMSKNRWDRRRDLRGATIVNGVIDNSDWAVLETLDSNCSISWDEPFPYSNCTLTGSRGLFQENMFYFTDGLNVTIETVETPYEALEMSANGSWGGEIGMLQRKEIDVASAGLGIKLNRLSVLDFTSPIHFDRITLIGAKPKAAEINIWVYVRVFGITQWAIFVGLMTGFTIALTLAYNTWNLDDEKGVSFQNNASKALATSYLFTLQSGDHPNVKLIGMKMLTLTASFLTLVIFIYYNGDITAEMTSGSSGIPIRNFGDVIRFGYSVFATSPLYTSILSEAKPGSAKLKVYASMFEQFPYYYNNDPNFEHKKLISEPKNLWLTQKSTAAPTSDATMKEMALLSQLTTLNMDDLGYVQLALAVQKDSEFLEMFNYFLLKEFEHGVFNRLDREYNSLLYRKEEYGMNEPQALGFNNIIFLFTGLGIGVSVALAIATLELLSKKLYIAQDSSTQKKEPRTNSQFVEVELLDNEIGGPSGSRLQQGTD